MDVMTDRQEEKRMATIWLNKKRYEAFAPRPTHGIYTCDAFTRTTKGYVPIKSEKRLCELAKILKGVS